MKIVVIVILIVAAIITIGVAVGKHLKNLRERDEASTKALDERQRLRRQASAPFQPTVQKSQKSVRGAHAQRIEEDYEENEFYVPPSPAGLLYDADITVSDDYQQPDRYQGNDSDANDTSSNDSYSSGNDGGYSSGTDSSGSDGGSYGGTD